MKKILSNKLILFIFIFIFGNILSIYMFPPSFNPDGICQLCYDYKIYSNKYFLEAGRLLLVFIWHLLEIIKLDHNVLSVLSVILSNLFLSLSVITVYNSFKKYINEDYHLLLLLSSLLIIYNPFIQEIFIFEESFLMCLAIYLTILASLKCFNKDYVLSIILLLVVSNLYQGALCYFPPFVMMLSFVSNSNLSVIEYFKKNKKEILSYILVYVISLVLSYISLILISNIFNLNKHIGNIDLYSNVFLSISYLIKTITNMFNQYDGIIYLLSIFFIITILYLLTTKNNKIYSLAYVTLMILICMFIPLLPNLVMKKGTFYLFPRMILPYGSLLGFISIFILLYKNEIKNSKNYLLSFFSIILVLNSIYIVINNKHFYDTYKENTKVVNNIKNSIDDYELRTNNKVKIVYYKIKNEGNINFIDNTFNENKRKIYEDDSWVLNCALNNKYIVESKDDINTGNYLFFEDDSLYIDFTKK